MSERGKGRIEYLTRKVQVGKGASGATRPLISGPERAPADDHLKRHNP